MFRLQSCGMCYHLLQQTSTNILGTPATSHFNTRHSEFIIPGKVLKSIWQIQRLGFGLTCFQMEIGYETCNNTCATRLNSIYEGHLFLNLAQHAGEWPTSRPTHFATKEQTTGAQYNRRLCGDQTTASLWARTEKSLSLSDNAPWSTRTETGQYDCAIPNTKYCSHNDTSGIHWKWITLSSFITLYDSCHCDKLHSLPSIGQWSWLKLQSWRTEIWLTILYCTYKWECQPCYRTYKPSTYIHTHTHTLLQNGKLYIFRPCITFKAPYCWAVCFLESLTVWAEEKLTTNTMPIIWINACQRWTRLV